MTAYPMLSALAWDAPAVLTAQRILIVAALVAVVLLIGAMLAPPESPYE